MKTIRTIIATLSTVLLAFALVAWFSVRRNAAFIQRTIYQGFDQTFVVALVMGCAFLLIAVILTVAIVSTENDEEDGEDEEELVRPVRQRQSVTERTPASKGEQAYRRVSRPQHAAQPGNGGENGFSRPKDKQPNEQPRQKKQARAAESPEDMDIRSSEDRAKKVKKSVKSAHPSEKVRIDPALKTQPAEAEEEQAPTAEMEPVKPAPDPKAAAVPEMTEGTFLPAEEPETVPTAPEAAPEAVSASEEATDVPDTATEKEETIPEATDTVPEEIESAPEPKQEEPVVRCVFCGSSVSRDSLYCPHCGKKM